MSYTTIRVEPGPVTRIVLARPAKLNAQSWTMLTEMDEAFRAADLDPACRVIVLSGEGTAFSAGHDLTSADQQADLASRAAHLEPYERGQLSRDIYTDSHLRWRDLSKPTIAMVHGHCIFGGWMIAAAMDLVFAAEDALFLPSYGDFFSVPWDVGVRKAKELLFATRFIDAHEARDAGFVNRVYPAEQLEEETLRYAARVATQDPQALRLTKFAINQMQDGQGFTAAVRAVGASFIQRAYPSPSGAAPSAAAQLGNPRPAGLDPNGNFRRRIAEALALRENDLARNNSTRTPT